MDTNLDHTIRYLQRLEQRELTSKDGISPRSLNEEVYHFIKSKKRREIRARSWAQLKDMIKAS